LNAKFKELDEEKEKFILETGKARDVQKQMSEILD
jgi:hypothetical protein